MSLFRFVGRLELEPWSALQCNTILESFQDSNQRNLSHLKSDTGWTIKVTRICH